MDPAVFLLPEIILNEGRAFDRTPLSQLSSADRSPSQEGRDTRRLSGPSLQKSPETSNRQLRPAEPRLVMGGSAAQGASRASADSHQRCSNQRPVHRHLIPSSSGPVGPRAPGSPFPPRPHLVLTPLTPRLIYHPCFPPWSNRMTMTPVASTSNSGFGFSPRVMAPFRCAPPPLPQVYLHLPYPSRCLRFQSAAPPQLCNPDRVLRRAAQQSEEQVESEGQRSTKSLAGTSFQRLLIEGRQENGDTDGKTTESSVSPGSLPSLGEESLAERVFEEYMAIMDALGLQIPEGGKTGENAEDEKKRKVAYLEKLCSDESFIREVDSILHPEVSLLSADPEPTDVLLRELQHEQDSYPPSADSNAAAEETPPATSRVQGARSPAGTQSDTRPHRDGQNSPASARNVETKDGWTGSSPVRPEEPLQTDAATGHVDTANIFELLNSSLQLLANTSPDTGSTSEPIPSPATGAGGKIELSETAQNTTEAQNLLVSSQVPNKENVSGGSPRVETDFHSTHDSVTEDRSQRQESPKGQTDEINELPSVNSCEKTPHLTPAFSPETRKRHKTVAGTTTLDFYSLRSQTHKLKVSKGKGVQEKMVEDPPSSPDHTAGMQGQSLTQSPMKRYRQGRESSEERKARLNETETISSSPTKRGRRWRKKDEAQVETPGCKPTPPLRRSFRKSKRDLSARQTVVTRAGRKGTNKGKTLRSETLPTKYKDFILNNRRLGKEKGKAGRGRRAR